MIEVKYNDAVIASLEAGQSATLQCNGKKMVGDVVVTAPKPVDNPLPIEIASADEMTALLSTAEVGAVYKYTGETTDTYENGGLYVVEEVAVAEYTVTVSLTNPSGSYFFYSCKIYNDYTDNNGRLSPSGDKVGEITSATGSIDVKTNTGKLYIDFVAEGVFALGTTSTTGDITSINDSYGMGVALIVSSDGTATIDGNDYDD